MNIARIRLINLNNLSKEKDFEIGIEDFIDKDALINFKDKLRFLDINYQLSYSFSHYREPQILRKIIQKIFENYDIIDCTIDESRILKKEIGITDYILREKNTKEISSPFISEMKIIDDSNDIYVEVKTNKSGLSNSQLNWILDNIKKKKIYILYIDFE